jgi:hypothetical protein
VRVASIRFEVANLWVPWPAASRLGLPIPNFSSLSVSASLNTHRSQLQEVYGIFQAAVNPNWLKNKHEKRPRALDRFRPRADTEFGSFETLHPMKTLPHLFTSNNEKDIHLGEFK